MSVAAVLGDQGGCLRLFKQQNVARAGVFFERYGARSLVLARRAQPAAARR
ncbi:hypothetical protein Apa02nite_084760 [Actinoplanes palleronii]|uniref:Uncharacterized protein n=1 Tax=Actinoplanes palleronii TaxID=113570 RepID=A0ABQ4BNV8_9ACTN|nr:hypothetical protein Apa02nite_084760 [Actinoplanes palleronii]